MKNNDSIIFRSGLTMGGIVLLALLSMVSSMWIAESSKGDAAAINLAGSLRMQSYRIATRLQHRVNAETDHAEKAAHEISEFERRLAQLWQTGAISAAASNPRNQMLRAIETFWHENLRSVMQISAANATPPTAYLHQVDDFVTKLDAFVKLLEENTEAKILLLRLVQGVALFMTLVLIFAAMYQLHSGVVAPLRDLVELARKARGGDLSVRASHVGNDELGMLGQSFNLMAADLSAMYADLEARVEEQTQALRISNRSLELLYNTARQLGEAPPDAVAYQTLLADIERVTGMGSVHLCLIPPAMRQATQTFAVHPQTLAAAPPFCGRPNCEPCLGDGATHPLATDRDVFSIPIKDQEQQFGVLIVRNPGLDTVAGWQLPLLEAVARNIAAALRVGERAEHRRQLALLEERNAIARELHDSLAQSLSYLKIQVGRLQMAMKKPETSPDAQEIVAELREGLNSAYRQLRELISTFRLKMEQARLEDSLGATVREFSQRSGLTIVLDQAGWTASLHPNEQLQVMQIIREALNNVVKHARACQVTVRLRSLDRGEALIEIRDDGIGLPAQTERDQHFGLHIMGERAAHLGGVLTLDSTPGHGVQVRLRFQPTAHCVIATSPTSPATSSPEALHV
ncbi:MAG: two-component system, NarL family, nitrate/nitrite sensor histidine kinase NarX [Pseudomonadota bacterium]|nr:two-component system, NarL family, nitrate/nitrite sensor histidine kinase NarX [Pseudomonadota bacterium]